MRYYLTPMRMANIKKSINDNARRENPLHCWWECKLTQPLWRTVWRFLKKLGRILPYDPAIPLLHIYPEKIIIEKDTCVIMPFFIPDNFSCCSLWSVRNEYCNPYFLLLSISIINLSFFVFVFHLFLLVGG